MLGSNLKTIFFSFMKNLIKPKYKNKIWINANTYYGYKDRN